MRWIALLFAVAAFAQPRKTVFVISDAEGVAGVCRQDQTDPKDAEMRQLLTGEINAAVQGFLDGGADEVIVLDGHDGSQTLSVTNIHPRAKLLMGQTGRTLTLDRRYAALAFVGQHAMGNVRNAIMGHSFSSLGIQNMLLNGRPVGEVGIWTAMAGHFGTPVILLTGDRAAAEEMQALVPQTEIAVVKEGLGRYTCLSLSAAAAQELIREKARAAMGKLGRIEPYRLAGPVSLRIEYTTRNSLPADAGLNAGAEVVDDRTIVYRGKDIVEAWTRYRVR